MNRQSDPPSEPMASQVSQVSKAPQVSTTLQASKSGQPSRPLHPPPGPPHPLRRAERQKGVPASRQMLRQVREIMAAGEAAQIRLDLLTKAIAGSMNADVCSIYLRRLDDDLELFSTVGLNAAAVHLTRLKWGEGLVGLVATSAAPLNLEEASEHPAFSYRPEVGEDPLHGFLGVPIIRSGQVIGVLVIQTRYSHRYSEEDVEAAQTVATVLAEIVVAGQLLDRETTAEVDSVLHRPERVRGRAIVAGISIGVAVFYEPPPPEHAIFAQSVAQEQERLESALEALQASVDAMLADPSLSRLSREILEVYRLFAYDRGWARRLESAVSSGLTAESAVEQVQRENKTRLLSAKDPYLRERLHDFEDLSRRLIRQLTGVNFDSEITLSEKSILLAQSLGPAELLELDTDKIIAIVMGEGADTSHAAIVARSLGITLVGGAGVAIDMAEAGDRMIVDGLSGEIHIRPEDDILSSYEERARFYDGEQAEFLAMRELPCVTKDGVQIDLYMNAGLTIDVAHIFETGAAGIGLFRTELQFLVGRQLPSAGEQEKVYREILDNAADMPVIFRTADLGSDKAADYMKVLHETNPAMGWRGLRMSLDREGLMRTQIRALLSAANGRALSIMLPLVTTAREVSDAKAIIDKEISRRQRSGGLMPESIEIGVMIEIPSAAWQVEKIIPYIDFLSIGGNDLAQFFFAADRDSERLSGRYDSLHPGFLTFIKNVVDKSRAAGIPISYCGEQAADPVMALALLAVGINRLSVPATSIGPLKRMIRSLDLSAFVTWLSPLLGSNADSLRAAILNYKKVQEVL